MGLSSAERKPPESPALRVLRERFMAVGRGRPGTGFPHLELAFYGLALTSLHWVSLVYKLPLAHRLQGWFWPYSETQLHHTWLIPLLGLFALGVGLQAHRNPHRPGRVLPWMVAFCWCLQIGVAGLEGDAGQSLRESLTHSGHWRMAELAASEHSAWQLASDYERVLDEAPKDGFLRSKPPGHVLIYRLTLNAATWVDPPVGSEARLDRFASTAGLAWGLLGALTLVPLFFLSRRLLAPELAWRVCLLYAFVPAVQLITGHLDLVLFPLLATGCFALAGGAARRGSLALAAAAGALCTLSLFTSFSLIAVFPLAVAVAAAAQWKRIGMPQARVARLAVCFLAGALAAQTGLWLALDYDVFARWQDAFRTHVIWQRHALDARFIVYAGILNTIELAYWWGVPLLLGWTLASGSAFTAVAARRLRATDVLALGTLAVLVLLCALSRTLAEVARLWAFLIPVVCVLVVDQLERRFGPRALPATAGLLLLQFVTLVLLKKYCDLFALPV